MRERRVRKPVKVLVAVAAGLMLWSVIAAPSSIGEEVTVKEPAELIAYTTLADAAPIQNYFDHQTRLVPLGPAIAHTQTDVSMPSVASGISWLVDMGVANGLHGTSTGNRVPTEASAKQPGGDPEQEFKVAGGPIGDKGFMSVRAGRSYARATYGDSPAGYANAFIKNVAVLPAAGAHEDAPGSFDPDQGWPGGSGTDPAPQGQMALVSIGSIASSSRSLRENTTVTSIGVAELNDINIGNRTSDNRCTNCIRIDKLRVEAFAEANGNGGGARSRYRVTLGRACRRSFDANTGVERDQCLPLDPRNPQGNKGLQSVNELEALNEQFEEPIWSVVSGGAVNYAIGVRIHAGSEHESPSRSRRTTDPKEDPHRNYADASKDGEVAKAVAEGLDIEVYTITFSQAFDDGEERIKGTPAAQILREIDQDDESSGVQVTAPGPLGEQTGEQTIPIDTVRSVRRAHMTFGVARAQAVARATGAGLAPVAPLDNVGALPPGGAPLGTEPLPGGPGEAGAAPGGAAGTGGGVGLGGTMKLRLNWASFKVAPWKPGDMAKGIGAGAIIGGAWVLARRRLRLT